MIIIPVIIVIAGTSLTISNNPALFCNLLIICNPTIECINAKLNGKEIKVEFNSRKNLRLDAYLLVHAQSQDKNDYNSILSYKELPADKVPSKAKEQLDK